jgi:hypothetical protein
MMNDWRSGRDMKGNSCGVTFDWRECGQPGNSSVAVVLGEIRTGTPEHESETLPLYQPAQKIFLLFILIICLEMSKT